MKNSPPLIEKKAHGPLYSFNSQSAAARLLGLSSLSWIFIIAVIVVAGYMGRHFTEIISFRIDDGWCPPDITAVGKHCFGDFGHPFARGGQTQVYVKDNLVAVNSPLVMFLFEFLRLFDYRVALTVFLIIGTLSVMSPIWWATRSWPSNAKYISYFLIGFGSLGFLTIFDRANPLILFPGLILWFVIAMENEKRNQVILAIAIMSAIKFWGPFFAIGLIMDRRWRDLMKCGLLTLALYIFPLFFFPGQTLIKIQITLDGITSQTYANVFQPYVISISGLIRRISCAISSGDTCNTVTANWGIFGTSFFTTLVALSVAGWAAFQFNRYQKSSVMRYIPLIALGAIALPTAQNYNSLLFIPAASLVLKWHSPFEQAEQETTPRFLIPALFVGIAPLPIWFWGDSILSSTNGSGPLFRISDWLIPIVWSCLILETVWLARKSSRLLTDSKTQKNRFWQHWEPHDYRLTMPSKPYLFLLLIVSFVSVVARRVSSGQTWFWGDDAILVSATNYPNGYSSNFVSSLLDTGQQKWRPFFQLVIALLRRTDLLDYRLVLLVNLGALIAIAFLAGYISHLLTRGNQFFPVWIAVIVSQSSFSAYGQSSIFGLMEFGAILFLLLGLIGFLKALNPKHPNGNILQNFSVFCFFGASLFHERYIFLLIAFAVIFSITSINQSRKFGFYCLMVVGVHFYVRLFILQTAIAKGGGGQDLQSVSGFWIVKHFFFSIFGLFGGLKHQYFTFGPEVIPDVSLQAPSLVGIVMVLAPIALAILYVFRFMPSRGFPSQVKFNGQMMASLLIFGAGLVLLIPASTVIERVETRWLFGSQVLVLIGLSGFLSALLTNHKNRHHFLLSLSLVGFLWLTFSTDVNKTESVVLKQAAQAQIENIAQISPSSGVWSLVIDTPGNPYTSWMFGYGASFDDFVNPPYSVVQGTRCPMNLSGTIVYSSAVVNQPPKTEVCQP